MELMDVFFSNMEVKRQPLIIHYHFHCYKSCLGQ